MRALVWRGAQLDQWVGQAGAARALLEEVIPLAEAAGDLWSLGRALLDLGVSYTHSGQHARARPYYTRAVAAAERLGDPTVLAFHLVLLGDNALRTGDWPRARADSERAEALLRQVPFSWRMSYPLLNLGYLDLCSGQWKAAERQFQEVLAIAERSGDLQARRFISGVLAECDLLEGRPEAARARLEPVLDLSDPDYAEFVTELPLLAWAYLDLGEVTRAADLVSEGFARARPDGRRLSLVDLLRVQALIAAEEALEEALAMSRDMHDPYAEAKVLWVFGQLHAARREPAPARERYEQALAICTRLGERLYAEQIERALARL